MGGVLGQFAPQTVLKLKPVGDIFLSLLLTAVIPLIFFAVSSAIANLESSIAVSRLIVIMILVFTGTVLLAALFAIVAIRVFPISISYSGIGLSSLKMETSDSNPLVSAFTVKDFPELFSQKSVLPLIIFSILIGVATRQAGKAGNAFKDFLTSGNAVMKSLIHFLMKLAPVGLGIYFACQLASTGAHLIGDYTKILVTAHLISILYFLFAFSGYAIISGGAAAAKRYWKYNISPFVTALATCSSVAAIPPNLDAASRMGVPTNISEISIPSSLFSIRKAPQSLP